MTTAHGPALSRLAGVLLGAITLLAAGCSAGGGSGPRAGPAVAAHDAVAVSSSGPALAGRAPGTTRPVSGRRGSGSRIAWAASLPRCADAAGAPASGRTGATDPGGRAGTLRPAPARCIRPVPVLAMCPRHPHLLLPCRER